MSQLVYGRNGQVRFYSEEEKEEAIRYLLTSDNVEFVHEDNQEQGAWGPEERIHFRSGTGVPECLRRNMTAGNAPYLDVLTAKSFAKKSVRLETVRT